MDKKVISYTYRCILEYINTLCKRAGILEGCYYDHGTDLEYEKASQIAEMFVTRKNDDRNEPGIRLKSIFNKLNGNNLSCIYSLTYNEGLVCPTDKTGRDEIAYKELVERLVKEIHSIEFTEVNINLVFDILEKYLSYIPYNTSDEDNLDISAYEGLKTKCAVMSCIVMSLEHDDVMNEDAFLLFSADISGIQKFIYRIRSKGALKSLRSRSFFLEIFMEHVIDEILEGCGLTRANLIYSGGGHCYILLPNSEKVVEYLNDMEERIADFLCRNFNISLFFGCGFHPCSGNSLINVPHEENPYKKIFTELRRVVNSKKNARYTPDQIRLMNSFTNDKNTRECSVCGDEELAGKDLCFWCAFFTKLSPCLRQDNLYVSITKAVSSDMLFIEVPSVGDRKYMVFSNTSPGNSYIRAYVKNKYDRSIKRGIKFLVCDYAYSDLLEDISKDSPGFDKVGVFRGDVDNLGLAFVQGFDDENLARASSFSRRLSVFFKKHVIGILDGTSDFARTSLTKERNLKKKVIVIYAGGDDVFLIGHWLDVIEACVDIKERFREYTSGTLTLSGGLKLVSVKYPLKKSADEAAELEDVAKENTGKNSICVIEPDAVNRFKWEDFKDRVINEKFGCIFDYCDQTKTGNSFLYNLLFFLERSNENINIARYAYLLARQAPDKSSKAFQLYNVFAANMMKWVREDKDRKELITALRIYLYLQRKVEGN
jgi:CRISPR-associated protein Csm1